MIFDRDHAQTVRQPRLLKIDTRVLALGQCASGENQQQRRGQNLYVQSHAETPDWICATGHQLFRLEPPFPDQIVSAAPVWTAVNLFRQGV
jgi:hypothetical protein